MNLVLELAEIEKQVNALISENINLKKENKELTEQNTSFLISVENLNKSVQELEAEVKEWKDKADLWCKTANLKDHNIMINKELEKHNEELIALINAERKRQEQCDDIHLRKIAELEKENAELKDNFKIAKDNEYEYSSLLTKAKELLTRFVMASVYFNGKETDLVEEAEQFIKNNA